MLHWLVGGELVGVVEQTTQRREGAHSPAQQHLRGGAVEEPVAPLGRPDRDVLKLRAQLSEGEERLQHVSRKIDDDGTRRQVVKGAKDKHPETGGNVGRVRCVNHIVVAVDQLALPKEKKM